MLEGSSGRRTAGPMMPIESRGGGWPASRDSDGTYASSAIRVTGTASCTVQWVVNLETWRDLACSGTAGWMGWGVMRIGVLIGGRGY